MRTRFSLNLEMAGLGTEDTITRIAQTRHDIGVFIQVRIQRSDVKFHVRMRIGEHLHAFRGGHQGHEDDVRGRHARFFSASTA
jgi:hypothetical protein